MILNLDCRAGLAMLPDNSIDAILTDPPYELGFMGSKWDATGIAYDVDMWRDALRVLKPGGHLLAFSGSRTYHRMTCAIEDAGFDVRDQMLWVYGSGFPKSLDISKAIDKAAGAEREVIRVDSDRVRNPKATGGGRDGTAGATRPWIEEAMRVGYHEKAGDIPVTLAAQYWQGWGTTLKPAHEPICVARKPLGANTVAANILAHGVGGLNIDACRVPVDPATDASQLRTMSVSQHDGADGWGMNTTGANPAARVLGVKGRWPANLIHDGSPEVLAMFPETAAASVRQPSESGDNTPEELGGMNSRKPMARGVADSGGTAARFFQRCEWEQGDIDAALLYYCAKASKRERNAGLESFEHRADSGGAMRDGGRESQPRANDHPTVKPLALGRYLARLICPPGGTPLDLFGGSGTFPLAAKLEGFTPLAFELGEHFTELANARLAAAQ